jgi:hypothetical protein
VGQIPIARAQALPGGAPAPARPASAWQAVTRHARDRADDVAFLLVTRDGLRPRTWAEVSHAVDRAAAGLIRSGLRVDQVVLSLLPADHPHPELDLALRAVGAVVVHAGPDAAAEHVARDLAGTDVRLVVAERAEDVARLEGLSLARAELFTVDDGRGWARLLELGAERLVMDPSAVERADSIVDPAGSAPRLLSGATPVGQAPVTSLRDGVIDGGAVVLAAGDAADPLVQVVREAHLRAGFTLCLVEEPTALPDVVSATHPSVLVVPARRAVGLPAALEVLAPAVPRARRPRGWRAGSGRTAQKAAAGPRGLVVVTPAPSDEVRRLVSELGGAVEVVQQLDLLPADLPVPPPVVMGDAAELPRRARRSPAEEFELRLGEQHEPAASAFSLPSLPLMSGESFLDQLLLSRAREARE